MDVTEFLASLKLAPTGPIEGCSADWFDRTGTSGIRVILGVSDGLLTLAATEHHDGDETETLFHLEADVTSGQLEPTTGGDDLQRFGEFVQTLPAPRSLTGLVAV